MTNDKEKMVKADDVTNISLIYADYQWNAGYNEFAFNCKIQGEENILHLREVRTDDGSNFAMCTDKGNLWEKITSTEAYKLDDKLQEAIQYGKYQKKISKLETLADCKELEFELMENDNPYLNRVIRKLWSDLKQKREDIVGIVAIDAVKKYCKNEFLRDEYGFDDLAAIPIGYTTLTDKDVDIEFVLDLERMELSTFIDNNKYPERIENISLHELEMLTFDDLLFGWTDYIEDIYSFKEKTDLLFKKLDDMNANEIENYIRSFIQEKVEETEIEANIVGIAVAGSRSRGIEHAQSDLDIVVELDTTEREDFLFDLFHENAPIIDGISVDINPITKNETGNLAQYLTATEKYLSEKKILYQNEKLDSEIDNNTISAMHRKGGRR